MACGGKIPKSCRQQTIHECAMSGDLDAFQKLLYDIPFLLNERNSVMKQTPLHIAASNNRVDILKFMLEFECAEQLELEAKNNFGETPLHMAAKNGCHEAVQLLLDHGASVEAKASNGMTPLHLAVWSASATGDLSTIKTLLMYDADCNTEDNEGVTPMKLALQNPGSKMLHQIMQSGIEQKRTVAALDSYSDAKRKMDELENALSKVVGLPELKIQLKKWAKGLLLDERRTTLGIRTGTRRCPHMAFLGNPGTGKTMVARILGRLLHMVGVLPSNKVTEVQRTDLVGQFVGHTGPKTRTKVKEAEGGVLFVDEAYRLVPQQKSDEKDYGLEALEEIMSVMDEGNIVVIFAGYTEPMKRVIASNEGFRRRVTRFFYFDDFSCIDLARMVHIKMIDQAENNFLHGFCLHESCSVDAIAGLIERETTEKQRREMNGGLVDAMLVNARENLDFRLDLDCWDTGKLCTIRLSDLEAGLRHLSN